MNITIQNKYLSLVVDTLGAQMLELNASSGTAYLWNGDANYWVDRAPVLFPFVARLYRSEYSLGDDVYSLPIHGFAMSSDFILESSEENRAILLLEDNEETRAMYPYSFQFRVIYELKGNLLSVTYSVKNTDNKIMPFGLGAHPGFRIPFAPGTDFEDYYLRFSEACTPDRVGFTDDILLSGHDESCCLEDGRYIRLNHALFDDDAIVLKNMARSVTLGCDRSNASITVSYPNMPYLGIWQMPHIAAPYVCIEPWLSLPGRQGIVEDLYRRRDLVHLSPNKVYENTWTIEINEG